MTLAAPTIMATLRHGHTHHAATYQPCARSCCDDGATDQVRNPSRLSLRFFSKQNSEQKTWVRSRLLKSWESDCVFFETVTGKRLMGSNAVERFECFPDSRLSLLIESYWVVIFISSPTLFPIRATIFTNDTFGPREPMVPLHSRFRCSMYKSHGMFFPDDHAHLLFAPRPTVASSLV